MFGLKNITKTYQTKGQEEVHALDGINITLNDNGLVFILGKSGSGKSTLLNVMGGLDSPTSGEIIVDGVSSLKFSQDDFDGYRNTYVGFVFQEFNILEEFSVGENIALALRLQNVPCSQEKVDELLKLVDLEGLSGRNPRTLSGGQKQRVAIARALIKDPKIIMADEPTGSLDSATGEQVFNTLKKLSKEKLVVVVSHDRDFAMTYGDRIIELSDGKVISDVERVEENGAVTFKNVRTFDDSVIISDASKLSDEEAKNIIALLKKKGGEAVIAFGDKNTEEVKKVINHKEQKAKGTFAKSKPLPELTGNSDKKEFVKSKLPLSHALKMGTSGFKRKPIRFAFTVFLSVIAFCLFGVMTTLMFYTPAYSVSCALQERSYRSVVMSKSYDYIERSITVKSNGDSFIEEDKKETAKTLFGVSEIEKLNKNSKGLDFAGIFTLDNPDPAATKLRMNVGSVNKNNTSYFKVKDAIGFSDCGHEYLERNGVELIAGVYPQEKTGATSAPHEVAVSEYFYELFKSSNVDITDPEIFFERTEFQVISKAGTIYNLKPTAIYRCSDLSKYEVVKDSSTDEYKDMLPSERSALLYELYETLEYSLDTVLFVAPDFYDTFKSSIVQETTGFLTSLNASQINIDLDYPAYYTNLRVYTESILKYAPERFTFYDANGVQTQYEPNDKEIWVSKEIYDDYVEELGSPDLLQDRALYVKNKNGIIREDMKFAGYFELTGRSLQSYFVTDSFIYDNADVAQSNQTYELTKYSTPSDAKYNYVVTYSNNTVSEIEYILANRNGVFMEMENDVYTKLYGSDMISSLNSLKKIFLVAGVALGILSSLMLYNFISVSIATKRKEMGILRAVGAGRRDVFRIFFTESILLAVICFVLAAVLAGIAGMILNNVLFSIFEMQVVRYTLSNVFLICLISFAISIMATIFPVMSEAKKSPVESIRQL